VDAVIKCLKVDWASCIALGFLALDFIKHHWLWLAPVISFAFWSWKFSRWWSPYREYFHFPRTRLLFMGLHLSLWLSTLEIDKIGETESKDGGKETAETSKPASLRKHQRQISLQKGYGLVEPVIGESARRLTTMIPSVSQQ